MRAIALYRKLFVNRSAAGVGLRPLSRFFTDFGEPPLYWRQLEYCNKKPQTRKSEARSS